MTGSGTAPVPEAGSTIGPMPPLGSLADRGNLADNRKVFGSLVSLAQLAFDRDELDGAAHWTAAAAWYASRFNPGCWQLSDAERLLLAVKERAVDPVVPLRSADSLSQGPAEERVLFVISEGLDVGGHTRITCRWMEDDPRAKAVVFTRNPKVPDNLASTAARVGAPILTLDGTPLQRALQLRTLASRFDLVVLVQLTFDPVPTLALGADPDAPPVVYYNQGDYCAWLGVATTNVIASFRERGSLFAEQYRHVPREHLAVLPLAPTPIQGAEFHRDNRASARRAFGVDDADVVLLTVASGYKNLPFLGLGFPVLLHPVLASRPRVKLIAIGMDHYAINEDWQRLVDDFPGRVYLLPTMPVPEATYWLSDIYLDTVPLGSALSAADASLRNLPVVALNLNAIFSVLDVDDGGWGIIGVEAPGFRDHHFISTSLEDYYGTLQRLIDDTDYRRTIGHEGCQDMLELHGREALRTRIEEMYAQARRVGKIPLRRTTHVGSGPMEVFLAELCDKNRWGPPLVSMVEAELLR